MNKLMKSILAFSLAIVVCGCSSEKSSEYMSYADFMKAENNDEVVIETYIQDKSKWCDGMTTLYTQNNEGGYLISNYACSEEVYNTFVEGQKIKVTGTKSQGEYKVEIVNAVIELEEGNQIFKAKDFTDLITSEDLIQYQNQKAIFTDLIVDESGIVQPYTYNWDDSGTDGDDLYFMGLKDKYLYQLIVESTLCDENSDVYQVVKSLNIGDTIDIECYLIWDDYFNPYVTSITIH